MECAKEEMRLGSQLTLSDFYSQEVAWQVEGSALHVSGKVQVLAEDLGQGALTQLRHLGLSEASVGIFVLVPGGLI